MRRVMCFYHMAAPVLPSHSLQRYISRTHPPRINQVPILLRFLYLSEMDFTIHQRHSLVKSRNPLWSHVCNKTSIELSLHTCPPALAYLPVRNVVRLQPFVTYTVRLLLSRL